MLHPWPYQLKEQREEQLLQKKVCVDLGVVELSSRIPLTGHENDQPIASMNCMWGGGPCVLMCLGQFWLLSFAPAVLLARLPFVHRNIKF